MFSEHLALSDWLLLVRQKSLDVCKKLKIKNKDNLNK